MKKERKNIILIAVAAVIIIVLAIGFRLLNRTSYNDENTLGNTSSNLLNGGLFCEIDDKIYFANPYDQNTLYSMSSDLQNPKQIFSDNVSYLNGAGKHLYYTRRNDKKEIDKDALLALSSTGLYRINTNGTNLKQLYDDPTQVACLLGNNVYYQHYDQKKGLELYSASIDGKKDTKILEQPCAPYAVKGQTIYYSGASSDHAIHSVATDGSNDTVLSDGNYTALTLQGDYLYFMDMNANYALKRMPLDGGSVETLISDRLATYNVSEDGQTVYCQIDNGTANGLYALDVESKTLRKLKEGNFNYLHLTKKYLLYEKYDQSVLYAMDLSLESSKELHFNK